VYITYSIMWVTKQCFRFAFMDTHDRAGAEQEGRNVRRKRKMPGINQEVLAEMGED
jgi:hypothetical protein